MRRAVLGLVIAAVVAVVVVVVVALLGDDDDTDGRMTFALSGPGGTATGDIRKLPSGWRIDLDADLARLDKGEYYQAWLKNDADTLVPIGTFNEGEDVILWAGVSPLEFTTLTVTREKSDGDQASSGDRVLVGTLEVED